MVIEETMTKQLGNSKIWGHLDKSLVHWCIKQKWPWLQGHFCFIRKSCDIVVDAIRGISSAGRAHGWQPWGQGFDPPMLHHKNQSRLYVGFYFFCNGSGDRTPRGRNSPVGCFDPSAAKRPREELKREVCDQQTKAIRRSPYAPPWNQSRLYVGFFLSTNVFGLKWLDKYLHER